MGITTKSGSFYSFGDVRLGQGRENSKAFLRENQDVARQIERLIKGDTVEEPDAAQSETEPAVVASTEKSK